MPLQTPNFKLRTRVAIFFLFVFAAIGAAKTKMDVQVGYDDKLTTLGRWVPVFVTLSDPVTRNVELAIEVPGDAMSAMAVRQSIAIGPGAQTFVVYVPENVSANAIRVRCADRQSGKLLANFPDSPDDVIGYSGTTGSLILTSGQSVVLRGFRDGNNDRSLFVADTPARRLPDSPIGYDSVTCLVLIGPSLTQMTADQQNAIVTWLKLGGRLIYWPGNDPLPKDSPLIRALPCAVGEPEAKGLSPNALKKIGLSDRFANLSVRQLSPTGRGWTMPFFPYDSGLHSVMGWVGAGKVVVLPSDPSVLQFDQGPNAFWNRYLDPMFEGDDVVRRYTYQDPASEAAKSSLDLIGEIPGTGSFGFGYIALMLSLLALVVGPVDYFVLKRLGKPAWTWATTLGWIVLVTSGALFAGHMLRSGELHFHTLQVLEQVDDQVLMREDLALIYAPQSREHRMTTPELAWWQPIADVSMYQRNASLTPVNFHQSRVGNTPESMWIDVWSYRFLRGVRFDPQPAIVKATIRQRDAMPNHVDITLQNLGKHSLQRVKLVMPSGMGLKEPLSLSPGQTLELKDPPMIWAVDQDVKDGIVSISSDTQLLKIHPRLPSPSDIDKSKDPARRSDAALIYGEIVLPESDLSIDPANAKTLHRAFFRAVVPAEGFDQ